MKVTSVSVKGAVSFLLPGEKDKFERSTMVGPKVGRTMTLVPGCGVLIETKDANGNLTQDPQLVPFEHIWYARIARPEAKVAK